MNLLRITLISLLSILIITSDYHGHLQDINGEYLSGDYTFDESKPFDVTPFESNQLRHKDSLKKMLIKKININLRVEYENLIHLKITDPNNPNRWEVPDDLIDREYRFNLHKNIKSSPPENSFYTLNIDNNTDIFSFELKKENDVFYTFSKDMFLFTDRYINFEFILTSNDIYGFGERGHELKLNEGIYTIWPNDTGGIQYDEGKGGYNGYSHQPIGLHKTKYENVWLGFVFLNSNCQDVVIKYKNDGITSLQHRTIGGVIDYYIIVGQSPVEVVQNIQKLLGNPFLPPYWAVGHHQSRYGFNSLENFKKAYNNYALNEIPLDTMWADIDSYNNYQIFSVNQETFKGLGDFIEKIHNEDHAHFIPIVDIGVGNTTGDKYIELGRELSCFIKSNYTKKELFLEVWPGATAFPDYFNPNATIFWEYGLTNYRELVHYDGIWYDMNEIACLTRTLPCVGEMGDISECRKEDNYYYYEDLPYLPGYNQATNRINLAAGTINENAILYGSDDERNAIYNTKPILSYTQNKITFNFLKNKLKIRPFIISRSATMGSGKYNGHWLGDNYSEYKSMKNSVDGLFQFVIYGITMTGDDICGFFSDGSGTLCNRWYNLGAFYPFSRNHNFNESPDHYPWTYTQEILNNIKYAVNYRYMILRYIYSHLFASSLNEKVGFFNPVFFSFPNDPESYKNMNEKIMIGDAFILFPIFTDDTSDIIRVFPKGKWFNIINGKMLLNETDERSVTLSGAFDIIHLYMRGGMIIPWQNTLDNYIKNSYYLRQNNSNLLIFPDENNKAKGLIFFDNDEVNTIENKEYIRIDLDYENGTLSVNTTMKEGFQYAYKDNIIGKIELVDSINSNCDILINLKNKDSINDSMDKENDKFVYDLNKDNEILINDIINIIFTFKN